MPTSLLNQTMTLADSAGARLLTTLHYRLHLHPDRPYVDLYDGSGSLLAELFIPSSIHTLGGLDDTVGVGHWQVQERDDEILLTLPAASSVWAEKRFRLRCRPHRFTYEVAVTGQGRLTDAHFFGGYYSGQLRLGSGFFPSGQAFRRAFTPEPNADNVIYFSPAEGAIVDLGGGALPGRFDWYFTPPPFAFCFEGGDGWLAIGIGAPPGENRFGAVRYHGGYDSFYLTLPYEGYTGVDGSHTLPPVSFDFAPSPQAPPAGDPYEALAAHVQGLRDRGLLPDTPAGPRPPWWSEPIFSGWGAQCYLATQTTGGPDRLDARRYCRQAHYERFLAALDRQQLAPGIVVIDDKWQAAYALNEADEEKWPDLPGFIRRQHEAGRRVLLWLKAWDPEGAPAGECIVNAAAQPVAFDPTCPAYEARLRAAVRRMLSPAGYDADGFKIDFPARIPAGPGLTLHGDAWGLELMKRYLAVVYDEARRAKPDALIMTHTPHPYLADVLDMIRLNDIPERRPDVDVRAVMTHRARVAAIACPHAVVDSDNWPLAGLDAFRAYLLLQVELGVPSLYYSSHMDSTGEPFTAEDYRLIRDAWARYRARLQERNRSDE